MRFLFLTIFSQYLTLEISNLPVCNDSCIGAIIRGNRSCADSWDNDSEEYHLYKEYFHKCTQEGITLALESSCWENCIAPGMEYTGAADCEDGFGDGDQDEDRFFKCLIDLGVC